MNDLIKVNYESDRPTVLGRDLHAALEVETEYRHWFPRMTEYGFIEGVDFNPFKNDRVQMEGGRLVTRDTLDHQLTIDMAKEICMLQRSTKGKMCREYFIAIEKEWNRPEAIMARALQYAERQLNSLRLTNSELSVQNAIMLPKAEYFDELVERNLLTNFRDTAKQLGLPPRTFTQELVNRKFLYRDSKGTLLPYEAKNNGLFEVKESINQKTEWAGLQTLVTPRGRETFRLLFAGGV